MHILPREYNFSFHPYTFMRHCLQTLRNQAISVHLLFFSDVIKSATRPQFAWNRRDKARKFYDLLPNTYLNFEA